MNDYVCPDPIISNNESITLYPNPAISSSNVQLDFIESGYYQISLINNSGIRVAIIDNNYFEPGSYQYEMTFDDIAKGSYQVVIKKSGIPFASKNLIIQ